MSLANLAMRRSRPRQPGLSAAGSNHLRQSGLLISAQRSDDETRIS